MPRRWKKTDRAGLAALCALLSIWFYAIMSPKEAPSDILRASLEDRRMSETLIVDPGHGGLDGGASTAGGTPESRFNWEISLRLRDLSRFLGIPVTMTRDMEGIDYPAELSTIAARKRWDTRARVEMINGVPNGELVSIHQNFYPAAGPWGAQVLYAAGESSRRLGEQTQEALRAYLTPENRRVAVPAARDIYIMTHVQCPAILVECGFLSHPREAALLATDGYQIRLAAVLAGSFLQFTEESA